MYIIGFQNWKKKHPFYLPPTCNVKEKKIRGTDIKSPKFSCKKNMFQMSYDTIYGTKSSRRKWFTQDQLKLLATSRVFIWVINKLSEADLVEWGLHLPFCRKSPLKQSPLYENFWIRHLVIETTFTVLDIDRCPHNRIIYRTNFVPYDGMFAYMHNFSIINYVC